MLKIGTLAQFSANISCCTTSLSACMPPWSIGNALVKHHAVSMMSLKDGVFRIGLYGGSAWVRFLLLFLYG